MTILPVVVRHVEEPLKNRLHQPFRLRLPVEMIEARRAVFCRIKTPTGQIRPGQQLQVRLRQQPARRSVRPVAFTLFVLHSLPGQRHHRFGLRSYQALLYVPDVELQVHRYILRTAGKGGRVAPHALRVAQEARQVVRCQAFNVHLIAFFMPVLAGDLKIHQMAHRVPGLNRVGGRAHYRIKLQGFA